MHKPDDESTDRVDEVLSAEQRLEREELHALLARQAEADERVVRALSRPTDG